MEVFSESLKGPFFTDKRDSHIYVGTISDVQLMLHKKCHHHFVRVKAGPNYRFFECKNCDAKLMPKEWIEI
jgi:hypothetical protein